MRKDASVSSSMPAARAQPSAPPYPSASACRKVSIDAASARPTRAGDLRWQLRDAIRRPDRLHDEDHPVIGEGVVLHDHVVGHADQRQHERGDHAGAVLACGAMEHRRQVLGGREERDDLDQGLGPFREAGDVVATEVAVGE